MVSRVFHQIWEQLRGKRSSYKYFLEEVRIQELRGIKDLRVPFTYPVSVIAGPNACGKSTVLFSAACAYKVPEAGLREFTPSSLFPNFKVEAKTFSDNPPHTILEFYYQQNSEKLQMRWSRSAKAWNKSFMGRKGGEQPRRTVYLRTLSNLMDLTEVRSIVKLDKHPKLFAGKINANLLTFAQRILQPFEYKEVFLIKKENNQRQDFLYARRQENQEVSYSELQMSAGERAVLRISHDISGLENALVLIDEIEAGLHPYTQQQIMLELQRLALRNSLQVIVTSHSPVVLECVPPEGRIFLEREHENVSVKPPHRDIIQRAFYGQTVNKLSILCEDDIAEASIYGILDYLHPKLMLLPDDISVGRDTGKTEFGNHIRALSKFNKLDEFIFVLDGDARGMQEELQAIAKERGQALRLLFLPGDEPPEQWIWKILIQRKKYYAGIFSIDAQRFDTKLAQIESLYSGAADKPTNIIKGKIDALADFLRREPKDIARIVAYNEARGEMSAFATELEDVLTIWRNQA
jgi:predicted ATPase